MIICLCVCIKDLRSYAAQQAVVATSDAVKQMPERQSTLRASRSRQSTARRELRRLLQHSAFAIDISQELLANSGGVQLAGASM